MGKRTKRVIGALWSSDIPPAGEVEECWECVDFTHARPPQKPGLDEGESIGALWRLHVALPPVQTLRLGPEDTHQLDLRTQTRKTCILLMNARANVLIAPLNIYREFFSIEQFLMHFIQL